MTRYYVQGRNGIWHGPFITRREAIRKGEELDDNDTSIYTPGVVIRRVRVKRDNNS